jgi:hypothetical protein
MLSDHDSEVDLAENIKKKSSININILHKVPMFRLFQYETTEKKET